MKFWSERENKFIYIDESLITRSHVKVPNQSEPVPIQSMEQDIIDQFMEDVMKSDEISEETKQNLERRCGKERREGLFQKHTGMREFQLSKDKRRQHERRGRKTAEALADFNYIYSEEDKNEEHWDISIDEFKKKFPGIYKNLVEQAQAQLRFLNY